MGIVLNTGFLCVRVEFLSDAGFVFERLEGLDRRMLLVEGLLLFFFKGLNFRRFWQWGGLVNWLLGVFCLYLWCCLGWKIRDRGFDSSIFPSSAWCT